MSGTPRRLASEPRRRVELTAVLVASDPGLVRLRLAARAVVAVGVAAMILHRLGPALGIPDVVAMLLGGTVGLMGAFATAGRVPLDAAVTLAGFPCVAAVSVSLAAAAHGHRVTELALFVVVMVAATFVRRFGPRWFNYGMLGWQTYFFTTFIGFVASQIMSVLAVLTVAAGCALLAAVLMPDRPAVLLRAATHAFDLRLDALLTTVDDGLNGALRSDEVRPVVHGASFRLLEAALIIDGYLASSPPGGSVSPSVVRHNLLDTQLAAEQLAAAAVALTVDCSAGPDDRVAVRAILVALLRRDLDEALRLAASLRDHVAAASHPNVEVLAAQREVASAVPELVQGLRQSHVALPPHAQDYQPAVTMFLGNLPGTSASASAAIQDAGTRSRRVSQNTRLCAQVAIAGSLTIVAGDLISPQRYYWAVLACFLTLTGTFTTSEIAVKGGSRVVGTVLGLIVATITVHVTGEDTLAIVAIMLTCVFLGLYFFRVSYAVMAFAITTIMGELYNVLHEFSTDLLLLRLTETAVGAGIGLAVALLVLPLRTADVTTAARRNFLKAVDDLHAELSARLVGEPPSSDLLLGSRTIDAALHQLALVVRPLGGATLLGIHGRRARRQLGAYSSVAFNARAAAAAVADAADPGTTQRLIADLTAARGNLT